MLLLVKLLLRWTLLVYILINRWVGDNHHTMIRGCCVGMYEAKLIHRELYKVKGQQIILVYFHCVAEYTKSRWIIIKSLLHNQRCRKYQDAELFQRFVCQHPEIPYLHSGHLWHASHLGLTFSCLNSFLTDCNWSPQAFANPSPLIKKIYWFGQFETNCAAARMPLIRVPR